MSLLSCVILGILREVTLVTCLSDLTRDLGAVYGFEFVDLGYELVVASLGHIVVCHN